MPAIYIPIEANAICQICGEVYAKVTIHELSYPLQGSMFRSPDRLHGIPDPFILPGTPWEDFRCPFGRIHRPIVKADRIWTDEGMVVVPKDGSMAYIDYELRNEIDRDSIADRFVQVSDDEAERLARIELNKGAQEEHGEADREDKAPADGQPIEEAAKEEKVTGMICTECGRSFKNQQALAAHIKAHTKTRK